MSSSTDSLKKKVCVTVFLDELFEEVEEEERREPIQVSEITESVARVAEKPFREPSRVDLGNDERVNVSPNADTEQNQVQVRPRKHRRESKFSKNRYDSFKNELTKYGCGSRAQLENGGREPADTTPSDSDFDLDDFLELDKWALENSRTTFTELSEHDFAADSFLSVTPALSSAAILCPKDRNTSHHTLQPYIPSTVIYCHKSTQFDATSTRDKSTLDDLREISPQLEEPPRDNSRGHVHVVLADNSGQESCEGDRVRHYDLGSLLQNCVKGRETVRPPFENVRSNASTDCNESDLQATSTSYSCTVPRAMQDEQKRPLEVQKVWVSTKGTAWTDGFESDLSEADCGKDIGPQAIRKESLLRYTLCVKCKDSSSTERADRRSEGSRSSSKSSFRGAVSREASLVLQAVAQLADGALLGSILRKEQKKSEGDLPGGAGAEGRSKNFAEGDTISRLSGCDSGFILDLNASERLFVCDEILKHVGESKVMRNEIIVNRAEIELRPPEEAEVPQAPAAPEVTAEVLFNQTESLEKTDAESELVFAESENFCESEEFFWSGFSMGPAASLPVQGNQTDKDVCVVEFEEKLSRSNILRRMKTVEILGDNSLNDMKNISTEVILICENISNNEVCMEAWESSSTALKNLTEVNQCYLKDSRDSAMYLIEIPLHFTHPKKSTFSESEHFFKPSDSD